MLIFWKGSSYSEWKHLFELVLTWRLKRQKNNTAQQCSVWAFRKGKWLKVGRKKGKCVFFSRAGQSKQEVHVSESGSAETALKKSDKKVVESDSLFRQYTD